MTPYAVLLVKPSDTDETVRRAYHAVARETHPDGTASAPTERWYEATLAYTAIKTADGRAAWERRQVLLANRCTKCAGAGTVGTRMFKGRIKVCEVCGGEGVL
jgi:DnaJ-class molecular chaperone